MTRHRRIIGMLAAAAISLSALPAGAQSIAERYEDLYEAAKEDGEVVFYTSYRQETSNELLAFWRENFPDVRLNIVQKQSLDLIPTIEAEKAAGRTNLDLVFINQRFIIEDWIERGFITPHIIQDFDLFDEQFKHAEGYYYVPTTIILSAAYNPEVFPDPSELPTSIEEFLDPKWSGRIVFSHPRTAASQLTWFQALLNQDIIDWDTVRGLAELDILFTRGNAESVRLLVAGERDLSPLISSHNVITAKRAGQSIELYVLEEGAVLQEHHLAIFEGGPNPDGAKLLLEVLLSPEGQQIVADGGSYWPTHPDALPPEGLPALQDIKTISHNEEVGGEASSEFLDQFDEVFDRL